MCGFTALESRRRAGGTPRIFRAGGTPRIFRGDGTPRIFRGDGFVRRLHSSRYAYAHRKLPEEYCTPGLRTGRYALKHRALSIAPRLMESVEM